MNGKYSVTTLRITLVLLCTAGTAFARVIDVPADQPTIQAAIDVASNGDTVVVSPGSYVENLNFNGKAIKVNSSKGAKATTINGNQAGPVVTFSSGETAKSILSGFTITNGMGVNSGGSGGGIYCNNSSPTIEKNIIVANIAAVGAGIEVYGGGSPQILGNTISGNIQSSNYDGGWGGGIDIEYGASATVIGNTVSNHLWNSASGAAIGIYNAESPLIENNKIYSNTATSGPGGGIWVVYATPLIIQNLIYANTAQFGGGVYIDLASPTSQAIFVNNTFSGNVGNGQGLPGDGSAVYLVGYADELAFYNNIFVSSAGRESVFCSAVDLPSMVDNDGFSTSGNGFGGDCVGMAGTGGNISVDPQFVKAARNNYRLKSTSPAVNAGDNSAPDLPAKDLKGKPRIVGATVDIGVYEFQ